MQFKRMDRVMISSSDGQVFDVHLNAAYESLVLKNIIEDMGTDDVIPLQDVPGCILRKVLQYCTYHHDAKGESFYWSCEYQNPFPPEEVEAWDAAFLAGLKDDTSCTFAELKNAAEAMWVAGLERLMETTPPTTEVDLLPLF
jgi:Skp1 family, tetramerisation domain